jgi:5'-3' exonuclease
MILVDLNQVMISNMMAQIGNHTDALLDEGMLRHMILNTLRANRNKFHNEYGELLICADDKNYWRRKAFPYYKASRRKNREESEIDWNMVFTTLNKIKAEISEFFPYKVIQIETAEADDIIGTIVHLEGRELNIGEPILILSGDKDYIQLHKYANVKQYDPTRKRWISNEDPEAFLYEQIIRGDSGDGVPNVLSSDNCFVVGERQKPVTKKRIEEWKDVSNRSEEVQRNFKRNQLMIDLSYVPDGIKEQIIDKYNVDEGKDRSQLLNYFIKNKLRNLMENISEF